MTKEHENILIEDPEDGIRRIILNRPNKRNALSNSLRKELFTALEEADQDKQVKVIILSGAGKCFSAGYDQVLMYLLICLITQEKRMVSGQDT